LSSEICAISKNKRPPRPAIRATKPHGKSSARSPDIRMQTRSSLAGYAGADAAEHQAAAIRIRDHGAAAAPSANSPMELYPSGQQDPADTTPDCSSSPVGESRQWRRAALCPPSGSSTWRGWPGCPASPGTGRSSPLQRRPGDREPVRATDPWSQLEWCAGGPQCHQLRSPLRSSCFLTKALMTTYAAR